MTPKTKSVTNHIFKMRRNRGFAQKQLAVLLGHHYTHMVSKNDLHRLPRYLAAASTHTKPVLLEAAKTAMLRHELNRTPVAQLFFEALAELEGKELA